MRRNAKVVNDNTWNMKQAAVLMGQKEEARRKREAEDVRSAQAELDLQNTQQTQPAGLRIGKNVNPIG
jgi:hypothetical protein